MASLDCLGALPQFSIIFIYRMGRMCALFVCRNSTFGAFQKRFTVQLFRDTLLTRNY